MTKASTTVRFDPAQLAEADKLAEALRRKTGAQASRSSVMRDAMARGLTLVRLDVETTPQHSER